MLALIALLACAPEKLEAPAANQEEKAAEIAPAAAPAAEAGKAAESAPAADAAAPAAEKKDEDKK